MKFCNWVSSWLLIQNPPGTECCVGHVTVTTIVPLLFERARSKVSSLVCFITKSLRISFTYREGRAPLEGEPERRCLDVSISAPPHPPQGSIKKEFPQNLGGSDTCYFCQKRVYVMERLSAEGKFFHRSCFKCEYCATTLRLSAYAYDIEDGESILLETELRALFSI